MAIDATVSSKVPIGIGNTGVASLYSVVNLSIDRVDAWLLQRFGEESMTTVVIIVAITTTVDAISAALRMVVLTMLLVGLVAKKVIVVPDFYDGGWKMKVRLEYEDEV